MGLPGAEVNRLHRPPHSHWSENIPAGGSHDSQNRCNRTPSPNRSNRRQINKKLRGSAAQFPQTTRSTIIFLISAIAFAGFNPLGQVFAQFMIV